MSWQQIRWMNQPYCSKLTNMLSYDDWTGKIKSFVLFSHGIQQRMAGLFYCIFLQQFTGAAF